MTIGFVKENHESESILNNRIGVLNKVLATITTIMNEDLLLIEKEIQESINSLNALYHDLWELGQVNNVVDRINDATVLLANRAITIYMTENHPKTWCNHTIKNLLEARIPLQRFQRSSDYSTLLPALENPHTLNDIKNEYAQISPVIQNFSGKLDVINAWTQLTTAIDQIKMIPDAFDSRFLVHLAPRLLKEMTDILYEAQVFQFLNRGFAMSEITRPAVHREITKRIINATETAKLVSETAGLVLESTILYNLANMP